MGNLEGVVGASFGPLNSAQERADHRERMRGDPNLTYGDWAVEAELEEELVAILRTFDCFEIHRQITGKPLYQPFFKEMKTVRADLLLIPGKRLLEAGWTQGAILVEVKRSGERIGPGLSQLMDYLDSAFTLPSGVTVVASCGFLFPAMKQHKTVASIMQQNRIGNLRYERGALEFISGETHILTISAERGISVGFCDFGKHLGSR